MPPQIWLSDTEIAGELIIMAQSLAYSAGIQLSGGINAGV